MKTKYRNLLKDTIIFGIGGLGSKLILFFMVPLYTNFLNTEQYGTTELIYTFQQLIVPFVSVVIFDGVIRFGLSKNERKEDVLLVGVLVATIGSIITVAITPIIGLYNEMYEWKWYLCIYIIFSIYSSVLQNYLKVKEKNILYAIVSIAQTLALALLNVLFLCVKNLGVSGYLLATIGAFVVSTILSVIFGGVLKDLFKAKFDKDLLIRMLKFTAPAILNNISWWVIHSADRLMIKIMIDTATLGIYAVAAKIPALINTLTSIFQQAWGISTIKEFESSNDTNFYSEVFTLFQTIVIGAVIVIILILKPFMSIYVGKAFIDAWQYVPLLLTAASFCAFSTYWGAMYGALKRSVNSMITTLVSAIINVVLNYFLIIKIGVWGAIIATVVSYFVISVIRMIDINRYIKININIIKLILNSAVMLAVAIMASLDLYIYVVSAIGLFVFIAINIKELILIIKKIFRKEDAQKEIVVAKEKSKNNNSDEEIATTIADDKVE